MWSYYGSKTNIVNSYPKPVNNKIFEPFAGAAKYSLRYFDNDVTLIDKYPVIIDIWNYLQSCSKNDILMLPKMDSIKNLNEFKFDCPAAKSLMGFIIQYGVSRPGLTVSQGRVNHRPNAINYTLNNIANNLFKIKHWKFICGDYLETPVEEATYFIDPPYENGGHSYVMSNKFINYCHLGEWCKNLPGQVIVCENTNAKWLPFVPMKRQQGSKKIGREAIWTNKPTHFNNIQQEIFK